MLVVLCLLCFLSSLARALQPSVLMQMKLSDGSFQRFEVLQMNSILIVKAVFHSTQTTGFILHKCAELQFFYFGTRTETYRQTLHTGITWITSGLVWNWTSFGFRLHHKGCSFSLWGAGAQPSCHGVKGEVHLGEAATSSRGWRTDTKNHRRTFTPAC